MEADLGLSVEAQRCRDAALPELLHAVRQRGRRRRRRRALAAVVLLVLVTLVVGRAVEPAVDRSPGAVPSPALVHGEPNLRSVAAAQVLMVVGSATSMATVVRDDPGVLARHAVATEEHASWFVDDAGLQALLREDGRAEGLVRIAERVLVRVGVVDPYGDAP